MKIESVKLVYFSPTGTTRKILHSIAKGLCDCKINILDLTVPENRNGAKFTIEEDMAVIGVPVYAEKIPYFLHDSFKNIKGNGKPVLLVSVYGNIGKGIALNELQKLCTENGFVVIGGASFIGEHSFTNEELCVAKGRPDSKDLELAEKFGSDIYRKLLQADNPDRLSVTLPKGSLPIIARLLPPDSEKLVTKQPKADKASCTKCGACATTCPVGAINPGNFEIREELCLRCFSCVRKCPAGSRKIAFKKKLIIMTYLKKNSSVRKEPEVYM